VATEGPRARTASARCPRRTPPAECTKEAVVGEHADPWQRRAQLRSQPADVVQPGDVGHQEPDAERGGLLRRATDDDHVRPAAVQPAQRRRTDAVAGTGDDDDRGVQPLRSTTKTGISRSVLVW
jgi:hypothetical protein